MSDEAKRLIVALRARCAEQDSCRDCPMSKWCNDDDLCTMRNDAAGLIESLSAELEQVKAERDAAVKDLKECSYFPCMTCSKRKSENECEVFGKRPESLDNVTFCGMYEWRGVQEHGIGADNETR